MIFLNEEEITKAISNGIKIAVQHTVDTIKDENEEAILSEVYDKYSPSWYSRTYDFVDAWDTKVTGGSKSVEGEMFYESSFIGLGSQETGEHVSVVDGSSQAQNMPELLYQSAQGCIDRPTHRDAWKVLDIKLTNRHMRSIIEAGLSKSGLPWKRSRGAITVTKTK